MPAPQTEALHRALALISEGWSITAAAKEAGINKAMQEKLKGLKDWQILQKSFDRLK